MEGVEKVIINHEHKAVCKLIAELLNATAKTTVNFSFSLKDDKHILIILPSAITKLGLQIKNIAIEHIKWPASVKFGEGIRALTIEHQSPAMVYATLIALLGHAGIQVVI